MARSFSTSSRVTAELLTLVLASMSTGVAAQEIDAFEVLPDPPRCEPARCESGRALGVPPEQRIPRHAPWVEPSGIAPMYGPADSRRLAIRRARREARLNSPLRLRFSVIVDASPRAVNGFGPYDPDDQRWVYFGPGLRLTLQRYLGSHFRVDGELSASFVFGDYYTSGHQGPMATLGARAMFVAPWRFHTAIGLGADVVAAREVDEATRSHFGWFGARIAAPVLEFGWLGVRGQGLTIQITPTFTYAPYDTGLAPGAVFSLGYEFAP